MVKSITSVILLLNILCGVQQFLPVSCDDCNSIGCVLGEILSFLPFMSSSGSEGFNGTSYDYYYDYGNNPSGEEEIIIVPLTMSAPEVTSASGLENPTNELPTAGQSYYDNVPSNNEDYEYGQYSYPVSESGAGNDTATGSEGLIDHILDLLGISNTTASSAPTQNVISAPAVPYPSSSPAQTNTSAPASSATSSPAQTNVSAPASTSAPSAPTVVSNPPLSSISSPASSPSQSANTSTSASSGSGTSSEGNGTASGSASTSSPGSSTSSSGTGSGSSSSGSSFSGSGSGSSAGITLPTFSAPATSPGNSTTSGSGTETTSFGTTSSGATGSANMTTTAPSVNATASGNVTAPFNPQGLFTAPNSAPAVDLLV